MIIPGCVSIVSDGITSMKANENENCSDLLNSAEYEKLSVEVNLADDVKLCDWENSKDFVKSFVPGKPADCENPSDELKSYDFENNKDILNLLEEEKY